MALGAAEAILVATSASIGAAASVLAWAHARRVARTTRGDLPALTAGLKRIELGGRAAALLERAKDGSWERGFAEELAAAPDGPHRVAAANDAIDDLAHALDAGASWPGAAVRIAAFGSLLVAVVAFLVRRDIDFTVPVLAPGGVGVVLCLEAGRRARAAAAARKRDVDALVEVVLGPLAREAAAASAARRRRRRDGL